MLSTIFNEERVESNRHLKFPCTRSKNFPYAPFKRDDSAKTCYSKGQFIHSFTYLFTRYLWSPYSLKGTMLELTQTWPSTPGAGRSTEKLDPSTQLHNTM